MSARFPRPKGAPGPTGPARVVVAPEENVLAALKALADMVQDERDMREALTLRVEALEAAEAARAYSPRGIAVHADLTPHSARDAERAPQTPSGPSEARDLAGRMVDLCTAQEASRLGGEWWPSGPTGAEGPE